MSLEKVKREFIHFMEEVHGGNPYPKNFFGCLIPLMIEPEPISQERIMELTGYSQTTVSLTLQKIELLFPLRRIKKSGERKNYYIYNNPSHFILDLTQRRTVVQDIDIPTVEEFRDSLRDAANKNAYYQHFLDYLNNLLLFLTQIHKTRSASAFELEQALKNNSLKGLNLHDTKELERGELADFLEKLRSISAEYVKQTKRRDNPPRDYIAKKIEYFSKIRSTFNPLYSHQIINQFAVIHSVILEGDITQEEIEDSTHLPRSTISETLCSAVKIGFIKVVKQNESRIKHYQSAILFPDLMLSYFDRAAYYISTMIEKLSDFIQDVRKIKSSSSASKKFLNFLIELEKAYSFSLAFSKNMKVEMVKRLKSEYEQGFTFI
jgi:DNA-binding transcriptional regulator GbsR (MarR family)